MKSIQQLGLVGYGEVGRIFAAGLRAQVQGLWLSDLKLQDSAQAQPLLLALGQRT